MTDPSIIHRLREGEGADRRLDAELAVWGGEVAMRERDGKFAFFHAPIQPGDWAFLSNCSDGREDAIRELGCCLSVKHYTSSLDACIALVEKVLPGWWWGMGLCNHTGDGDVGPPPGVYGGVGPDFRDERCSPKIVEQFDHGFMTSLAHERNVSAVCRALLVSMIEAKEALALITAKETEHDR